MSSYTSTIIGEIVSNRNKKKWFLVPFLVFYAKNLQVVWLVN